MTWSEVAALHHSWSGIAFSDGKPASILCNESKPGPFPDVVSSDRLTYFVNGPSKTSGADRLVSTVGSGARLRVFQKLAVNEWRDLGFWTPIASAPKQWGYVAIEFVKC